MNTVGVNNFNTFNQVAFTPCKQNHNDNSTAVVQTDNFSLSLNSSSQTMNDMAALKNSAAFSAANADSIKSGSNEEAVLTDNLGKTFSNANNVAASCLSGSPGVAAAASSAMEQVYKIENRDKLSMDELVALANKVAEDIFTDNKNLNVENGEAFSVLLNKFKYDELPQVLTPEQFKCNQEESKLPVLYRGLEPRDGITTEKMLNDFKYGKLFSGGSLRGRVYGRGTYIAFDKAVADRYKGKKGVVMEMLLAPDAKIGEHSSGSFLGKFFNRKKMDVDYEFFRFKRNAGLSKDAKSLFGDAGSFAVLKGYDAYYCCKQDSEETLASSKKVNGYSYMVVLNREKVLVKE